MSIYVKTAAAVAILVVALTIYPAGSGIAVTGSGGLGAVSFGLSEAIVEFVVFTAAAWIGVWTFRFWRSRRRPSS